MTERLSNEDVRTRLRILENTLARGGPQTEALLDLLDAHKERDEALPVLEAAREVAKVEFCDWTDDELKEAVAWAGQRTIKSAKLAALVLSVRELNAARAAEEEEK